MQLPPPVADVAAAFTETVERLYASRPGPRFALMLSGGPTARECYEHLATKSGSVIDWMLVDVFIGDERVVPPDDADANQRLIHEALLDHLAGYGSFAPMPTSEPVATCVASYQRTLAELLAGPGLDVIHLGLGPDGHTASLFPGSPTLQVGPDELVAATEDPSGRNPHPRLTVTLPVINLARHAVFTVAGPSKVEAVAALRRGDDIPAAQVRSADVVWLIDDAATAVDP